MHIHSYPCTDWIRTENVWGGSVNITILILKTAYSQIFHNCCQATYVRAQSVFSLKRAELECTKSDFFMYEPAPVAGAKDSITEPTEECGALPKIGVNTPNLRKWLTHTPAHRHTMSSRAINIKKWIMFQRYCFQFIGWIFCPSGLNNEWSSLLDG